MNSESTELRSPGSQQRTILSVLAIHLVAIVFLIAVLCVIVPTFVKTLADMGVELPVVTKQVIWLSNVAVDYWYLMLMLAAVVDTVIIWWLTSLDASERWMLTAYSCLCLLATILFLVWVAIAICIPMMSGPVAL